MNKSFLVLAMTASLSTLAFSDGALILYDGAPSASEAFKSARFIQQLLGHFDPARIRLIRAADYRAGEMSTTDVVFAAFEEDRPEMTAALLNDLGSFRGPIVWLNMHVERFLESCPGKYGLVHEGYAESAKWQVLFQGTDFEKDDAWINVIRIPEESPAAVLAEAVDANKRRYPYAIRADNLWYFADSPFAFAVEGGRFLILAELLHEILGMPHAPSRRALVRIEDVNPESDPAALVRIADYLAREGVPFQISLIPILKDPDEQADVLLSERPAVVEALAHMISKGGTVILHGATHQHRGRSGDDYEFWDDIAGTPIPQSDPEWTDRRVRWGLEECFRCGIHPLAWETPHYSASASDYRAFAKYFDTFYDRVMSAELAGTQQPFPYPVRLPEYGVTVVPENLGYVEIDNPDPSLILRGAERMKSVRDGMASFFFHPFVPIVHLKTIIRGMKKGGWTFLSIRDFPCNLRTDSRWVTSAGGEGRIVLANQYAHALHLDRKGKVITEDFAAARRLGVETRRISLAGGSLYVFEGLDMLPALRSKSFRSILARLNPFKSEKIDRDHVLKISRALILSRPSLSQEDEFDRKSFYSVLNVFGLNPDTRDPRETVRLPLSDYNLVIVPRAAAEGMQQPEVNALWDYVSAGGSLLLDGPSALAEALGLHFEPEPVEVREVKELTLPAQNLIWNPPAVLRPLKAEGIEPLAKDAFREAVLAGMKKLNKGLILGLATPFDPFTPYGISRFPYLPFYLKDGLKLPFNVRRNALEFYFDPGLRPNASWEKLVKRWKTSGVKIVYLAAWHFYASYRFDYSYFIKLCHDQGIAVYAWFEFPQVTPLFWDAHPEWREKTATGKDGLCHWRLQMNLANPEAQKAVVSFFRDMLSAHDWDGVNLAELNFDTNKGYADADKFTPMNADVRRDFREREGFDPIELFAASSPFFWKANPAAAGAFLRYRSGIVREWHELFLEETERVKKAKGADLEVIVTAMDSLLHPEIVEECGIDTRDIIGLMDRYSFTLQVEDPARSWTDSPARYLEYLAVYKTLIADESRLMFDVNCLADRDIRGTNLPSVTATGTELAATVFYASIPSGRVGIYAESTIHPFDLDLLAYVLGSDVTIAASGNGYDITAKRPFTLNWNRPDVVPSIGRKPWPFVGAKGMSAPSGTYRLNFEKARLLDFPTLAYQMTFDGDFSGLEGTANSYRLTYRSPLAVSLTFNRTPEEMRLDGTVVALPPERSGTMLPRGEHLLEIVTEKASTRAVRVAGYMTSSIFYILGLGSTLLLLGVYVFSRCSRWRRT